MSAFGGKADIAKPAAMSANDPERTFPLLLVTSNIRYRPALHVATMLILIPIRLGWLVGNVPVCGGFKCFLNAIFFVPSRWPLYL